LSTDHKESDYPSLEAEGRKAGKGFCHQKRAKCRVAERLGSEEKIKCKKRGGWVRGGKLRGHGKLLRKGRKGAGVFEGKRNCRG